MCEKVALLKNISVQTKLLVMKTFVDQEWGPRRKNLLLKKRPKTLICLVENHQHCMAFGLLDKF